MPFSYSVSNQAIATDVTTLLGRLTAPRAAALDELLAANIPTDLFNVLAYVDELETRLTAVRAVLLDNLDEAVSGLMHPTNNLSGLMRMYENYTLTPGMIWDNDDTFVTVLNITGRGIFVSCGVTLPAGGQRSVDLRVTIDGGGAITTNDFFGYPATHQEESECGISMMAGFASSLLVEMALSAVDTPRYSFRAVALVE